MSKLVCGVGVNDIAGITDTIEYKVWHNMLERCYSKNYQKKKPTYIGCSVCEEWHTFSNFKIWMEKQDWKGKQLDKDLLGDGKLYSPETCCFVEQWLNNLLIKSDASRGEYPLGVTYHKANRKFVAKITIDDKTKYIGSFDTSVEAHKSYLIEKRIYVQDKMKNYHNPLVKQAVLEKVK